MLHALMYTCCMHIHNRADTGNSNCSITSTGGPLVVGAYEQHVTRLALGACAQALATVTAQHTAAGDTAHDRDRDVDGNANTSTHYSTSITCGCCRVAAAIPTLCGIVSLRCVVI
jgi:hypothetical protein